MFSTVNIVIGLCLATKSVDLCRNLCASLLYFVVHVRYGREKSLRSLSHLLVSFLYFISRKKEQTAVKTLLDEISDEQYKHLHHDKVKPLNWLVICRHEVSVSRRSRDAVLECLCLVSVSDLNVSFLQAHFQGQKFTEVGVGNRPNLGLHSTAMSFMFFAHRLVKSLV